MKLPPLALAVALLAAGTGAAAGPASGAGDPWERLPAVVARIRPPTFPARV